MFAWESLLTPLSVTIIWFTLAAPLLCFPLGLPVTSQNMNCESRFHWYSGLVKSLTTRRIGSLCRIRLDRLCLVPRLGQEELPRSSQQPHRPVIRGNAVAQKRQTELNSLHVDLILIILGLTSVGCIVVVSASPRRLRHLSRVVNAAPCTTPLRYGGVYGLPGPRWL